MLSRSPSAPWSARLAALTAFVALSAASASAATPLVRKLTDKKTDSVYVVYFHDPADDTTDGWGEVMNDFEYHTGEALKPIRNWRMVTVEKREDKFAYRAFNPGDSLLFQIRWHGRQVMESAGVVDAEAMAAALRAVGILRTVPSDPDEE